MTPESLGTLPDTKDLRWWQDWRWIASVAGVLFGIAFASFVIISITNNSVLKAIETNQKGTDELVDFVRDLQQAGPDEEIDLTIFIDLLCSSDDPVRIEACQRLMEEGELHL